MQSDPHWGFFVKPPHLCLVQAPNQAFAFVAYRWKAERRPYTVFPPVSCLMKKYRYAFSISSPFIRVFPVLRHGYAFPDSWFFSLLQYAFLKNFVTIPKGGRKIFRPLFGITAWNCLFHAGCL